MRAFWLIAATALCLGAAPPGAEVANAQVRIDNFSFTPAEITVAAGTTVTWTNHDDIPHTVTGTGDQQMRSGALDTDDTFSWRFDHPGRFAYFCSLHAHMQGVVVVR